MAVETAPTPGPRISDLLSLVRAPAALSVPGDLLAGAAACGSPLTVRTLGMTASSTCLYWAGMALNDYADAAVDAVERPKRPVPSGRVPRRRALSVAVGLSLAGLGLAGAAGGRRGLATAAPLTALVWAYDLALKSTSAGPAAMAGTRALNVLGGSRSVRAALPSAAVVGLHTYTVTMLSRHEVGGAVPALPAATLAGSAVAGCAAAALSTGPLPRRAAAAAVTGYLGSYGLAQARAVRVPSADNLQRAVGAGILGLMPLQAALTAGRGALAPAAALAAGHPLARRLARRVSPT